MNDIVSHAEQDGRGRWFIERGGARIAEMTYRRTGEARILIDHTEVDPALRGQGIARRLLEAAVAWARQTNTKISARCPYVTAQFTKDPSIADVLG